MIVFKDHTILINSDKTHLGLILTYVHCAQAVLHIKLNFLERYVSKHDDL